MATSLEKSKKLNEVSKPLHLSTNPEILVKIALLLSQLRWLESRPLKKIKKNKEKTSVKYIALPASLPSGLNKHVTNVHAVIQTDNIKHGKIGLPYTVELQR